MAKHTGKDGVVKFGANALAEVTEFEVEETADTVESHAMGDTWKDNEPTFNAWNGSVSCHYDPADANGQEVAIGSVVTVGFYSDGDGASKSYLTGQAIVSGRTRGAPMDDMVSNELTLTGKGALTKATVSA